MHGSMKLSSNFVCVYTSEMVLRHISANAKKREGGRVGGRGAVGGGGLKYKHIQTISGVQNNKFH